MAVKANWFADAPQPSTDDQDPFAGQPSVAVAGESAPPPPSPAEADVWERRGETIHPVPIGYWRESDYTMATGLDKLQARLRELLQREANCDSLDITCPIKDDPEVACSACPISEVGMDTKKAMLCRIGREQERIQSLIAAKRSADGG